MPDRKRTAEEILRALETPSPEEEMDRALAMTEEEANAELLEAGYTPEELAEKDQALLRAVSEPKSEAPAEPPAKARAGEGKEPARVIPLRPRGMRRLWVPFAVAAGTLGPLVYFASELAPPDTMVGSAPDASAELRQAESLRGEAKGAFEAEQWARCIELLDEAKKKDPRGDEAPVLIHIRFTAMSKLGAVDAAGGPSP